MFGVWFISEYVTVKKLVRFEIVVTLDAERLKKFVVFPPAPAGPGGPCGPDVPDPPPTHNHSVNHNLHCIGWDSTDGLITGAAVAELIKSNTKIIDGRYRDFILSLFE
jgi:hypothetical protein